MDVLLVGGTGLISTAVTRELAADGHDVTLFNRGETDADVPDVEQIHGDRYDYDAFADRLAGRSFDCAMDFICYDGADADAAVRALGGHVEQFVLCSTVDVYRRPAPVQPITEAAERAPVTDYAAGKIEAEDRLRAADDDAFRTTVIRPWHTYGESGDGSIAGAIDGAPLLGRLRAGRPVVVHGDGTGMWGPCHREDVASAFAGAAGNADAYGETYHVTSGEPMTWDQYHRRAAAGLDAPEPDLVHVPTDLLVEALPGRTGGLERHYQYSTVFDNAKARRDLDFEYTIDFETGVARVADYLDAQGRFPDPEDPGYDRIVEAWRSAGASFVDALS